MGFLNLTYPNRRTFFITSFIILLFLLPLAISAQTVEFVSQSADGSVTMIVKDLPALSPVVRAEEAKLAKIPTPHYEYLWVFNDGEFINQSKDATVTHQFIGVEGSLRQGGATAFTTGVYSDDHLRAVADGIVRLYERRESITGLRFTYEPAELRFFQGRFEPIS